MAFTPLGDTLRDKLGKNQSLKKHIETAEAVEAAALILEDMFGPELAHQAKPLFLKNRTLTISCSGSSMAQEIRLNQAAIVEKINQKIGKHDVDRIRYLA